MVDDRVWCVRMACVFASCMCSCSICDTSLYYVYVSDSTMATLHFRSTLLYSARLYSVLLCSGRPDTDAAARKNKPTQTAMRRTDDGRGSEGKRTDLSHWGRSALTFVCLCVAALHPGSIRISSHVTVCVFTHSHSASPSLPPPVACICVCVYVSSPL